MSTPVRSDRASWAGMVGQLWPFDAMDAWANGPRTVRVEEFLDRDALVVRAEIPGIDPENDVEVTVRDGILTIAAYRREERSGEDADAAGYRSEFRYGRFRRSMALPRSADPATVTASYDRGVLEVRIPVNGPAPEPRKVPVTPS